MRIPLLDKFYVKRVCPDCFQDFYPGDCNIYSTTTPGKLLRRSPRGWQQFKGRIRPEPLTGREFTMELARRTCPHCLHTLPFNIERAQNISIAVVGSSSSGTSWYLAALMHQLEESQWITQDHYVGISCFNRDEERRYINSLFHSHPTNFSTESWVPLVFEISLPRPGNQEPKLINLIFYDTAIEDKHSSIDNSFVSRCVRNASALILLIDSSSIPSVSSHLPSQLQGLEQNDAYKQLYFISNLLRHYHHNEGRNSLSIPVAITISKSELLRFVSSQFGVENFFQDCQYNHGANIKSIETCDKNLREVLLELSAHDLLKTAGTFSNTKFFAVSATGYNADEQGLYAAIEPCRCLDPLLWILHTLRIITSD